MKSLVPQYTLARQLIYICRFKKIKDQRPQLHQTFSNKNVRAVPLITRTTRVFNPPMPFS